MFVWLTPHRCAPANASGCRKAQRGFTLCSPEGSEIRTTHQGCETSKCFLITLEISLQIKDSLVVLFFFLSILVVFFFFFFTTIFTTALIGQKGGTVTGCVKKMWESQVKDSSSKRKNNKAISGTCSLRVLFYKLTYWDLKHRCIQETT